MKNNLIERETLGQFADGLVAQKYQKLPDKYKTEIREQVIDELDDRICMAVFGDLSEKQLDELDGVLSRDDGDEKTFQQFFKKNGIDITESINRALTSYQEEFLGGVNV